MGLSTILGLAGSAIGAIGSRSAAKSQSRSAQASLDLARENRDLQERLYNQQVTRLRENVLGQNVQQARNLYDQNSLNETNAYNALARIAGQTRDGLDGIAEDTYGRSRADAGLALRNGLADADAAFRGSMAEAQNGFNREVGTYARMRDQSLAGFQPYADSGGRALGSLNYEMGLSDALPAGVSALAMSPAARFALEQGRDSIEAGASAGGSIRSGATMKALEELRMGMASQDRETQLNRLSGMADRGFAAQGSMAGIRDAYAGRYGAASDALTGRRTRAYDARAARRIGLGDSFAERSMGLNAARGRSLADSRGIYGQSMMGLRRNYSDNINALRAAMAASMMGERTNFGIGAGNALGMFGNAATQATQMQSNALADLGNARAAGTIGMTNSINDGLQNMISMNTLRDLMESMKVQP